MRDTILRARHTVPDRSYYFDRAVHGAYIGFSHIKLALKAVLSYVRVLLLYVNVFRFRYRPRPPAVHSLFKNLKIAKAKQKEKCTYGQMQNDKQFK